MLINVVVKRTADGKFIGWNILLHSTTKEDAKYTVKNKINLFEGVDLYVGATENRYENFVPVVRFIKENLDIFENVEASVDDFAKLLAVTLAAEFNCTARAGKD